ncbi:MAG: hypothetical protein JWR75_673 [Devosia sp.]|nr:hypothetical protein [Devosia sp.]
MQAAEPLFAATLMPHRALSHRGLRVVIAIVAILASIPGIVFFALGAWPIVGFMGLDVLAVWWALSASTRDGRRREAVTLWPERLIIIAVSPNGGEVKTEFHPLHVRLIVARDYEERTTKLTLREKDTELEIGSFLNAEEKGSFGRAFGTALRRARQPGSAQTPERHKRH